MENSKPLATESFSYSWLTEKNPQSMSENFNEKDQSFNFNFPFTKSPISLVHADEIFSGGHIMPVYIEKSKLEPWGNYNSAPQSPVASYSIGHHQFVANKNQYFLVGKLSKSSRRIFQKLFGFVKPLIGCSRKSNRVDDFERVQFEASTSPRPSSVNSVVDWSDAKKVGNKVDFYYGLKKVKSWNSSPQASPRISPSYSTNSWCDIDQSSIHEAIMYCKKSIEK